MAACQKQGKKPKKPPRWLKRKTPLKPGKKKIASKSVFKEWGKNCTKTYRRKFSDYEVRCQAEVSRQARLANATEAEEMFAGILMRLGIAFEREKIFLNGDRWVLADFYISSVKLIIELDGHQHRDQKQYDHGRSMWLAKTHGLKVVRFWNRSVLDGTAEQRINEMLGFGFQTPPGLQ
jgi:very-short-patch-repair endonuclease